MKRATDVAIPMVLFLGLLSSVFFLGTHRSEVIQPKVVLESFHDRYVTALEGGDWLLTQEPDLSECGQFVLRYLKDGKVALLTCHDRYVTAPKTGATLSDWRLWQASELDDCGHFVLHNLGRDGIALETCAGHFLTAGDGGWPGELAWAVAGETDSIGGWEIFKLRQPYTPLLSAITSFDSCGEPSKRRREMGPIDDPSAGNTLAASYVKEAGRVCIAKLEYDIAGWSAFRIQLLGADLSPYSKLLFDIRADPHYALPDRVKIELKRAEGLEVSVLDISGITTDWQTMRVNLSDFGPTGYADPLSSFAGMEELLFTFDVEGSGRTGAVYLDNISLQ